ncbi:hypothetical protein [Photobacterium rosenbergii]|uniref:Uncharacterized protein n=1 Tax=Photobacterium rosenbergii TaxID=294936 RepID=A0ABU3ZJL4_9GAMM|nr:hypothetical protein [Photobacterium rosenbergii]MDV5170316.1 hypothetical protein [Photobacterium rosenbergii]
MRKTHIALLVAVVSSPLALANDYYNPYYPSYDDGKDVAVSDSFNKTIDKTLTLDVDKEYTVDHKYYSDDDTLYMKDVNNKYNKEWIDNSVFEHTSNFELSEMHTYNIATSKLDGHVGYASVEYGGACCDKGGYGKGYGYGSSDPSSLMVTQSNDMTGAFSGASGINIAGQNAGNNSLVQQSASTNAALAGN